MFENDLVRTPAEYEQAITGLLAAKARGEFIAVDTETTGLNIYVDDVIRGVSIAHKDETGELVSWYVPVNYPDLSLPIAPLIEALDGAKQAYHNSPFDWRVLDKFGGMRPPKVFWDTQIAYWLIDENLPGRLKQLGSMMLGTDAADEQRAIAALKKGETVANAYKRIRNDPAYAGLSAKEARELARAESAASKKDWRTFGAGDLSEYAAKDTWITYKLGELSGMTDTPNHTMRRELDLQYVIHKMVVRGIKVDQEKANKQYEEAVARRDMLESKFEVNLRSPKQLQKLLYEDWGIPVVYTTRTGQPATDKKVLEENITHPMVAELLEFRKLDKAISSYYSPLAKYADSDGRVHSAFSSCRTVTGRFASSDPNMMTIPRSDTLEGIRGLFIPADGYELWEYDIVSAELFFQAAYSQDKLLIDSLLSGADLHSVTATNVFGPDFTGLQRRLAKNLNYGFSYGIGPKTFSLYMVAGTGQSVTQCSYWHFYRGNKCNKCNVCQAAVMLEDYGNTYSGLKKLFQGLMKVAERNREISIGTHGRKRHFPRGSDAKPFTALNAVVQGGVAEFMKDVMLELDAPLTEIGGILCLQVHDSLVIEVPPGYGQIVHKMIEDITAAVNPISLPIRWDAKAW